MPEPAATPADGQRNVLFVTWDGPETDYLRGLFLPIFAGLAAHGYRVHVLQFTWADAARRRAEAEACAARGVSYRSHGVLRRPLGPGSLLTAIHGRRAVRRAVRELGIDIVMPRSTLPALATMLAFRADVHVLTSLFEGSPLAIGEAMGCRLPVVCSDVGGCREMLDHRRSGFLVPSRDEAALVATLKELWAMEPGQRCEIGERAREAVIERCDPGRYVARLEHFYDSLRSGAGQGVGEGAAQDA